VFNVGIILVNDVSGISLPPVPGFPFDYSLSNPSISLLISYASLPIIIFCLFRPFAALAALKTRRQARGWTPGDRPRSGTLSTITRHPGMSN
jgi:hypothetical protein